jgi:hypothetical protein
LPPDVKIIDEDNIVVKFLGISFRSKWTPRGNIQLWDDLVGVTVNTTRVFLRYEYFDCPNNTYISDTVTYDSYNGDDENYGAGQSDLQKSIIDIEPIEGVQRCRRAIYENRVIGSTRGGYVPLVGAQVLIRDFFTLGNAITDSNGNFVFSRKRPAVRYHIQWERRNYSIRDNGVQAMLRGPKMRQRDWVVRINGGEDQYHADIHRGAHMYYYENLPGLSGPPTNGFLRAQMKIAAIETRGASNHVPFRRFFTGSQIRMKVFGRDQDQVIGVTIHELAHSVHWKISRSSYNYLVNNGYLNATLASQARDRYKRVMETYARQIEITYMNEFYRRLGIIGPYAYRNNLQDFEVLEETVYTSAMYDLTEDFNQSLTNNLLPDDPAEGYTSLQIEMCLIGCRTWDEYRERIVNLNIDADADVRTLFNNWD